MYNTVYRLIGDEHDSHDVVQEAFIKAFDRIDQFKYRSSFGAWLKRIMVNCAMDRLRQKNHMFTDLEIADNYVVSEDGSEIRFPNPGKVHEEIMKLPEGCKQVFCLYLLEGYSQKEVATEMGISLSTVKTQYMRAKGLLKERLKELML